MQNQIDDAVREGSLLVEESIVKIWYWCVFSFSFCLGYIVSVITHSKEGEIRRELVEDQPILAQNFELSKRNRAVVAGMHTLQPSSLNTYAQLHKQLRTIVRTVYEVLGIPDPGSFPFNIG